MRNGHVGEEWEGNTSIKGKLVALTGGLPGTREMGENELIKRRMVRTRHFSDQFRGDRSSHPIRVRLSHSGQTHLWMGFHENPDKTVAQRPRSSLFQTHSLQIILFGPFTHKPN